MRFRVWFQPCQVFTEYIGLKALRLEGAFMCYSIG